MLNKILLLIASGSTDDAYSRFVAVFEEDDPGEMICAVFDGEQISGSFTLIDGNDLTVEVDGTTMLSLSSSSYPFMATLPIASTETGVCRVENKTNGDSIYGVFNSTMVGFPCAIFAFSTLAEAVEFYESGTTELPTPTVSNLITSADAGKELEIAIYIEDLE